MKCPLCQFEFSDDIACKGCGFTSHCTMIKCPNCQYEFVEKSATVHFFVNLIHWFKHKFKRGTHGIHP